MTEMNNPNEHNLLQATDEKRTSLWACAVKQNRFYFTYFTILLTHFNF